MDYARQNPVPPPDSHSMITLSLAEDADRPEIYALRHQVYALELGQHPPNSTARLSDSLDAHNIYLKASIAGRLAGFISITLPGGSYSVDKYFARQDFPFSFDENLYEVRLLTVVPGHRRLAVASLLMYAVLRWIEARGGTRIVAIGRRDVLSLYRKAGLQPLGRTAQSGAVTYDLLTAEVADLRKKLGRRQQTLGWLQHRIEWRLNVPFQPPTSCCHGGAFFEAIGEDFQHLERAQDIISADVLDAWFPPSPNVISVISQHLPSLLRTSPPTACGGMVRAIARARKVPIECIVPAAGSSELIFLAFREWLGQHSRVLLLDPSYGEYAHVTERIVRCRVDRFPLSLADGYELHPAALAAQLAIAAYDLVVIVNPNSPTGRHVGRRSLQDFLSFVPAQTRVWIDETYVDYAGPCESLEAFAAQSQNVIVCKSMSKVYALSGARAAYLCAPAPIARALLEITPPWAVSLPAQVAAVKALEDPEYYASRYQETRLLREALDVSLRTLGFDVIPSVANFLLCVLPAGSADAAMISRRCRVRGLYVRDAGEISPRLGTRALRIAVKDEATNERIIEILKWAVQVETRRESQAEPLPRPA